jgi:hypothetical protein
MGILLKAAGLGVKSTGMHCFRNTNVPNCEDSKHYPPPHMTDKNKWRHTSIPRGKSYFHPDMQAMYPPASRVSMRQLPSAYHSSNVPTFCTNPKSNFQNSGFFIPRQSNVPGSPKFHDSTTALSFPKMHVNPMGKSSPESWHSSNQLQVV